MCCLVYANICTLSYLVCFVFVASQGSLFFWASDGSLRSSSLERANPSLSLYIYIYIYISIIYIYIYTHTHTCACIHMCVCIYIYIYEVSERIGGHPRTSALYHITLYYIISYHIMFMLCYSVLYHIILLHILCFTFCRLTRLHVIPQSAGHKRILL